MIWRVCLWSLTLLFAPQTALAAFINHPVIDLEQLQQIGIAGPYRGISLYSDTRQLTELQPSTASVVSFSNQTFELLASTSSNGSIYTTCTMPTSIGYDLYVGGSFVQLGPVNASNIAVINLSTGTVSALAKGLDGPVYSLYCDSTAKTVFVGGSFLAPVADAPEYAESLAYFGGGTAAWINNTWHGMPWKGFNGPVATIAKHENSGTVYFGGRFDTSADGQSYYAPASQPVSLASPAKISATNSGTENNDPQAVLCPATLDQNPWLLLDDTAGAWEATFPYSITPSLIRLGNTHLDGRGTQNFSIISIPNNVPFNLTYIDPVTKKLTACATNCTLSSDSSIHYQDFQISDTTLSSGIRVDISSWYGKGGGLSAVEVFMSEIFVYAVDSLNGKACASSMDYTQRSHVKATGSWKSGIVDNSYVYTLSTSMTKSQMSSSKAAVDFVPYLPEAGMYDVFLYAPACTGSCSDRTQVDVTTYSFNGQSTRRTVDLNSKNENTFLVYSGEVAATTTDFQPYVSVTVAHNATAASSSVVIDLQAVQFIKQASNTTLTSMLQFSPNNAQIKTNGTLSGAYGPLQDNVPYGSTVSALDATDGNVYIGGKFTSPAGSNTTYQNIVRYDFATKKLVALGGGGVNGEVMSLLRSNAHLYVGGSFTGLASGGDTTIMNNVARYDIGSDAWNVFSGGLNGPVESLHLSSDSEYIIASGNHTGALEDTKMTRSNSTSGNAWWSVKTNAWTYDHEYLSGTVYGVFHMENNSQPSTVYAGNLKAAQTYQSRGFAILNHTDELSPLPVYPDASKSLSITAGAYWSDIEHGNTTALILGGEFELDNGIENVVFYENETWTGIGAQWTGAIKSMAVNEGYLYIGGSFTSTNSTSIAVYDLVNKTFVPVPDLHTTDKSPTQVNAIHYNPQDNVVLVAGNFSTAGSLSCAAICTLDPANHQWNSLGDGGISGEALDFALTGSKLIVAGNLELNGAVIPLAQYDYDSSSWSAATTDMSDTGLPGNTTAVSYDSVTQKAFIAGQKETSAYLRVWDGQGFVNPDGELGPGSMIQQVTVLPVKEAGQTNLFGNDKTVLLAAGFLNLGAYGNLSSALYNGSAWIPYVSVSAEDGSTGALSSIFFKSYDVDLTRPAYLPAPIVVLVSVASALGIVFLIVLCGLCILYAKRRRESKVDPTASPATYYGKPPQRPESLLAMLNNADATGLMYDPKKGLSDDATIAGGDMYSVGKDASPEMTETNNGSIGATAASGIAAGAAVATRNEHIRDVDHFASSTPPANLTAQTRAADAPGVFNHVPSPEMVTVAAAGASATQASPAARNSYNPFRASVIGLGADSGWAGDQPMRTNDGGGYASRTITNGIAQDSVYLGGVAPMSTAASRTVTNGGAQDSMYLSNIVPVTAAASRTVTNGNAQDSVYLSSVAPVTSAASRTITNGGDQNATYLSNIAPEPSAASSNVRWTNAPTATMATAAVISDPLSTLSPSPTPSQAASAAPSSTLTGDGSAAVRWTNVPSAEATATATVGPVSMMSTLPASSSAAHDAHQAAVRWTNLSPLDGPATATVAPVSMYSTSSMLATNEEQSGSNVRWTNADISSGAVGTAMVAPVIAVDRESGVHSNTRSMANTPASGSEQEPSNVRWTNYTTHSDQGVAMLRPVTAVSMYSDVSFGGADDSDGKNLFGGASRPSMTDFSSDPDIVRWTTAPGADSAKATAVLTQPADSSPAQGVSTPLSHAAMLRASSDSTAEQPRSMIRQYESGLDLASLTVSDVSEGDSNDKYNGMMTKERPVANVGLASDNADSNYNFAAIAPLPSGYASTLATRQSPAEQAGPTGTQPLSYQPATKASNQSLYQHAAPEANQTLYQHAAQEPNNSPYQHAAPEPSQSAHQQVAPEPSQSLYQHAPTAPSLLSSRAAAVTQSSPGSSGAPAAQSLLGSAGATAVQSSSKSAGTRAAQSSSRSAGATAAHSSYETAGDAAAQSSSGTAGTRAAHSPSRSAGATAAHSSSRSAGATAAHSSYETAGDTAAQSSSGTAGTRAAHSPSRSAGATAAHSSPRSAGATAAHSSYETAGDTAAQSSSGTAGTRAAHSPSRSAGATAAAHSSSRSAGATAAHSSSGSAGATTTQGWPGSAAAVAAAADGAAAIQPSSGSSMAPLVQTSAAASASAATQQGPSTKASAAEQAPYELAKAAAATPSSTDGDTGNEGNLESTLFKTSSFRWSETPSLPPIDTNFAFSGTGNAMSSPLGTPDDPSVRWKETHAASPIERAHAPQIVGATAATVTVTQAHRQTNDDDSESSSDDDDDAASQSGKSSLAATAALDGRAASKRMVQDYFSSRDPALAGTKEVNGKQFHKDFLAAMEAAAQNNHDDLPSTEDHPHLYYAKFDFNAREHGELGFDKGDPIIVVDRSDDIWWMGYKDNGDQGPMQGVFPSNYVERASAP